MTTQPPNPLAPVSPFASASPTGGPVAGSAFSDAAGAASTQQELTIPVWREGSFLGKGNPRRQGRQADIQDATDTNAGAPVNKSYLMTESDARTQYGVILTDRAKMAEWSQLALKAQLVSPNNVNDANALGRAWDVAVGWAANIKAATKGATEVTPFEAAKLVAQNSGSALIAQQAYAASHFTGNRTTTSTSTDQRANSQTGDVLHQLLGRNPTAGEKATYQHGLNQVAAANPTTTTSVDAYTNGKQTGQTNTITGGYDEKAAAIEQASSASPDVARNQAATTYYQALVSALGAAV